MVFREMDEKINIECLMWLLIKAMGKQKHVAKALGVSRQIFNYWLNHAKSVPAKYLSKMLSLLHSYGIATEDKNIPALQDVAGLMPLSQLAKWAMEALLQNDSGQALNCQNFDNLTKNYRFDDEIAKKYGFGNRSALRQAIAVVKNGCAELIEMMDKKIISIYRASRLSALSTQLQQQLISKGIPAIKAYFNEQKVKQPGKKEGFFEGIKQIEGNPALKNLEIRHQLPLRKTLIGLSAQCDCKGQFIWDLAHLKTCLLLEEVPLEVAVDVLCQHQMIEKKTVGKKYVGQILI